jgi:hypothetical protein
MDRLGDGSILSRHIPTAFLFASGLQASSLIVPWNLPAEATHRAALSNLQLLPFWVRKKDALTTFFGIKFTADSLSSDEVIETNETFSEVLTNLWLLD